MYKNYFLNTATKAQELPAHSRGLKLHLLYECKHAKATVSTISCIIRMIWIRLLTPRNRKLVSVYVDGPNRYLWNESLCRTDFYYSNIRVKGMIEKFSQPQPIVKSVTYTTRMNCFINCRSDICS
jgi:hypothetical protein